MCYSEKKQNTKQNPKHWVAMMELINFLKTSFISGGGWWEFFWWKFPLENFSRIVKIVKLNRNIIMICSL